MGIVSLHGVLQILCFYYCVKTMKKKNLAYSTDRFWRFCYEIHQMAVLQVAALYVLQMKCIAVERKNAICWISKYDIRLAGTQKTLVLYLFLGTYYFAIVSTIISCKSGGGLRLSGPSKFPFLSRVIKLSLE